MHTGGIAAAVLFFGFMACMAAPAQAQVTFASFEAADSSSNISWTNTGFSSGSLTQLSGDSDGEGGVKDVTFSFSAFGLPTNLAADFDLTSTSTSPAVTAFGVLLAQPGITGGFHFTYDGPSKKIGGVMFNHGANLLSGTFTNAFITGIVGGGVASLQAENNTTGPINFTSDFLLFQNPCCGDEAMSLAFSDVTPALHINSVGDTLASFDTNAAGDFSADVVAKTPQGGVPEPTTWAMLMAGFAGVGAALRRRRSTQFTDPAAGGRVESPVRGISRIATAIFALGTLAGLATPAEALTFASFRPSVAGNTMSWTNTGFSTGSLTNIASDNALEAGVTDVAFSFKAFGLPANLSADFDFTSTSTSPTVVAFGVLLAQPGITGGFHFTYDGPSKKIGGVMFNHGANLLSGTFTNAFITGIVGGGVAGLQAENNTTGPINFTSDFLLFQNPCCGDEAISLAFNGITPGLHINSPGDTLASFSTSTTGNFSADVVAKALPPPRRFTTLGALPGAIPEPTTWALMLAGFGCLGAGLRRARRGGLSVR